MFCKVYKLFGNVYHISYVLPFFQTNKNDSSDLIDYSVTQSPKYLPNKNNYFT